MFLNSCLQEQPSERSSRPEMLCKKVFLEISQNAQESTCVRISFLIKAQPATLLKKRLWHSCFPVNFVKFLRTLFLTEHLWWLLLPQRIEIPALSHQVNFNWSIYVLAKLGHLTVLVMSITAGRVYFHRTRYNVLEYWPATLLKKRLWHRRFPVNFA